MALTLESYRRLEAAGLVAFFEANRNTWKAAAKAAYDYFKNGAGEEPVRQDDVAGTLLPVLKITASLVARRVVGRS